LAIQGSIILKEKLVELCKGSTRLFLTQSIIMQLEYPLPPLSEQQEIICRVDQLFSVADRIEFQYHSLKEKIDNLPQAILNKAFRGELVEQNPIDEPDVELLKRIQSEKGGKG